MKEPAKQTYLLVIKAVFFFCVGESCIKYTDSSYLSQRKTKQLLSLIEANDLCQMKKMFDHQTDVQSNMSLLLLQCNVTMCLSQREEKEEEEGLYPSHSGEIASLRQRLYCAID